MPVTGIFWRTGAGQDFHLVPGLTSPRLDQLLFLTVGSAAVRADNPPANVTVTWASNYAAVPSAAKGVSVDLTTATARGSGAVNVTAPLSTAATRLLDFLVVATVTEGANSFEAYIRFHIHEGVAGTWLTPAELSVPEGAHDQRFSMLAEFTDGTYGDITNWSPFRSPATGDLTFAHATLSVNPIVVWTSRAPGGVGVDPKTGVLDCRSDSANTNIDAVAGLAPPSTASGRVAGGPRWDTPVTLRHIAGPVAEIDAVPNVLILGDGFEAAEEQAFIDLAGALVKALHEAPRTRPFDLVKNRMNYFAAFRASPQAGVATLSPVDRAPAASRATPLDVEVDPAVAATQSATVAAPPTRAGNTEFLLNERNTAFGGVLGERPRAQRRHAMREVFLSDQRFSEDDFDAFLGALELPGVARAGERWQRTGDDRGSIVVLCRTDLFGAANSPRVDSTSGLAVEGAHIICMNLGVADVVGIVSAPSPLLGQDLVPDAIPARVTVDMRTTAAHELAHSYTIEDEYGGLGDATPGDELRAAQGANVQSRNELLSGRTFLEKLKWSWPRLVHAAKLTSAPVPAGAQHRLFFTPGEATNFPDQKQPTDFPEGRILRLRTHPLPGSTQSYRLRVTQVVGDAEVFVTPAEPIPPGFPALRDTFPPGSIVMEPKRAPDPSGGLGPDLELIHADVRQWIEQHQNPLNAAPNRPPGGGMHRPCPGPEPTTDSNGFPLTSIPARNFGPGNAPNPPTESAWITGLFEAGMEFDCNIYHPTGACIMNVVEIEPGSSYQFCWVCRYAIVDFIDPAMHGLIDRDYDYRYPR